EPAVDESARFCGARREGRDGEQASGTAAFGGAAQPNRRQPMACRSFLLVTFRTGLRLPAKQEVAGRAFASASSLTIDMLHTFRGSRRHRSRTPGYHSFLTLATLAGRA